MGRNKGLAYGEQGAQTHTLVYVSATARQLPSPSRLPGLLAARCFGALATGVPPCRGGANRLPEASGSDPAQGPGQVHALRQSKRGRRPSGERASLVHDTCTRNRARDGGEIPRN